MSDVTTHEFYKWFYGTSYNNRSFVTMYSITPGLGSLKKHTKVFFGISSRQCLTVFLEKFHTIENKGDVEILTRHS